MRNLLAAAAVLALAAAPALAGSYAGSGSGAHVSGSYGGFSGSIGGVANGSNTSYDGSAASVPGFFGPITYGSGAYATSNSHADAFGGFSGYGFGGVTVDAYGEGTAESSTD